MSIQAKKTFAMVDYGICNPLKCSPERGLCASVKVCTHKVIKQMDGPFEQPMVFQDMCMGCWDCIDACPLEAIKIHNIGG